MIDRCHQLFRAVTSDLATADSTLLCGLSTRFGQLDDSWNVTVSDQTVQVEPDDSFRIPNIAAPDQFGTEGPGSAPDSLSDDFIRVLGTSTLDGITPNLFNDHVQIAHQQDAFLCDPIGEPGQ
ncbi:MAG: hypothetical protein IH987_03240 [Planctomycetes bacterium]|nr:hypothetical protein [Planctomycetota bacterium]